MPDENQQDPYEAAGRAVFDMIASRRAASTERNARVAHLMGLAPAPDEAEPEAVGWTAEEQADLQRRKAEHDAAMRERQAGESFQTGRRV